MFFSPQTSAEVGRTDTVPKIALLSSPVNIDPGPPGLSLPLQVSLTCDSLLRELPAPNRITILSYTASLPFRVWHGRIKHHTRSHDKVSRQGSHEASE